MRKTIRTFLSAVLAASMFSGFAACGESSSLISVQTPIKVFANSAVVSEGNGLALFEEELKRLTGVDIRFFQPESGAYADMVDKLFSNPNRFLWPDIVLLEPKQYADYAASGVLADITSVWENSELRKSGRIAYERVIDDLKIDNKLYGIAPVSGNGYITYVKQTWLDKAGITELPSNYEEYIQMLKTFSELSPDGYALTAPGISNKEGSYLSYLPELFWDALPDFYQNEDGIWVDGFTEDKMKAALERLTTAYREGWLDPEYTSNEVSVCKDKFSADKCGIFTYWAGIGADALMEDMEKYGEDSALVPMPPIAEVGAYIKCTSRIWAITAGCKDKEKVFEIFFGTMLDGAEGQVLWTYGVEELHWSTHAETISIGKGDKEIIYEYAEGEFHGKKSIENKNKIYKKNHLDPLLSIARWEEGKDVGFGSINAIARESWEVFRANSTLAPKISDAPELEQIQEEIMSVRVRLVNKVILGELPIEEAMEQYHQEAGEKVRDVLGFLNGSQNGKPPMAEE